MYLGYMKRGLSLMLLFTAVISLSMLLKIGFLMVFLPVICFYSFFDSLNLGSLPYEQRMLIADEFLLLHKFSENKALRSLIAKRHVFLGILLIFGGIYLVVYNFVRPILYQYLDAQRDYGIYLLFNNFPVVLVAAAIVGAGIYLVRGDVKVRLSDPKEEYVEYKDDNADSSN